MKKLVKGLRRDENKLDQLEGSWCDARNIVITKANGTISNENGFDDITPTGYPNKKLIGVIVTNTKKVHFFGSTNAADSEIGIIDENLNYTTIIIDSLLNFHEDHPIQGVFQYKFNNNLVIAWTDSTNGKWNPYRILNLDCIPFGIEPDYSITPADLNKAEALLSLFPKVSVPSIDTFSVIQAGGNLTTGAYYFIIGYTLEDGSDTSWLNIYNPISIYNDNISLPSLQLDGDIGGIFTGKSLTINFDNINTNFKYLKLGYIKLENGVYTAQYVNSYLINGSTLTIDFNDSENSKSDITLNEVLIPNSVYPYGKTIATALDKLFLGNVETEPDLDFQPYANMVNLKWVFEEDINIYDPASKNTFKDEQTIFFKKPFKDDEVYAFYIALRNKNSGKWSNGFIIPGRALVAGVDDINVAGTSLDIAELDTGNPVPKFRVLETANATSVIVDPNFPTNKNLLEGDFGAWENENETYPDSISFDSTSLGGTDLRNAKVRHHKFPSNSYLASLEDIDYNNGFNYINKNVGDFTREQFLISGNNNEFTIYSHRLNPTIAGGVFAGALFNVSLSSTFAPFAGTPVYRNRFIANKNNKIKIKSNFAFIINPTALPISYRFRVFREEIGGNITVLFDKSGTIPISGASQTVNVWTENDIENTFETGLTSSTSKVVDYYFIFEDFTLAGVNFGGASGSLDVIDLNTTTVSTKLLGVKVENLNIPSNFKDIYDEWGIFYAKRTTNNIRVLGNDMLKVERLHTFDLMQKQVATKASYLKEQVEYFGQEVYGVNPLERFEERDTIFNYAKGIPSPKIHHIRKFEYAGENTNLNGVDNTNLASNIYIEAGKALTTPYLLSDLNDRIGKRNILCDLVVYRKNVYNSFQEQELVFTGSGFKINASGVQPVQKIYGGDIFNTFHGFLDKISLPNIDQFSLVVSSASNIGLRRDDELLRKYHYPKHLKYETLKPTISYYGYNNDYSSLNDLEKIFPATYKNNCFDDIYLFPNRIPYSLTEGNESSKINWRVFKPNDYYEMPKNKGVIWNLLGNDRILYIHHEYSLFIAQIKDRLNTSGEETYLGISDLFDRPPVEVLPVKEGYAGNTSQFATMVCKLGYCFIDRNTGRVFIYNNQLNQISDYGMLNFWFDNAQYSDPTKDNPFNGMGYTMAFDEENYRLIISKIDKGIDAFPFTLSYYSNDNFFISFHDYLPEFMYNNREGIYYVNNNTKKLFKGGSQTLKASYLDSTIYPSYIDVVFNDKAELTKRFQNAKWLSEIENNIKVKLEEKTITQILVYNNNQCSGLLNLQDGNNIWFSKDRKNVEETWQYNDFRDLILDVNLPFLDKNNALIGSNINLNKAWFKRNRFLSKFVVIRFQYDNIDQNDLYLIAVDTNYNISTKPF